MKGALGGGGWRTRSQPVEPWALRAEIGNAGVLSVPRDESLTSTSPAASVGMIPRPLTPAPAPEWRPPSLPTLGGSAATVAPPGGGR